MRERGCRTTRARASGALGRAARALRRVLPLVVLLALTALALAGQALGEGITNAGDDLRDGWYPEEGTLTPQLVTGGTFGKLWSTSVEGAVYAQPLLAGGTLLVATENDKVYGLNPANGEVRWSLNLGTPFKASEIGCADLTPNIGITSTPVIDPNTDTAYLTHKTYVSGSSGASVWYMDAINLATGSERAGFPVQLGGTAQNHPGQTFVPTTQLQRPGLLLMNGVVYAAFASDCDEAPYQGWVFGVSTSGEIKTRWVAVASGSGAGIWQSGAGIMSPAPGQLFVATGNGGSPSTPTPGSSPPESFGESIVHLVVQPNGELKPVDFFTPFDDLELDAHDADFGSGGVTALNPQYFGTASIPDLAVAVGKDGYVYLLNRENLGGYKQGSGGGDDVVQRLGPYGGVWSRPGVWPGDGGWVYIPTASASGQTGTGGAGSLEVFKYGTSGSGQPTLSLQATSSEAFGYGSSAPVITSEGTKSGSALVWVIWSPSSSGVGAQLRAYSPVPVEGKPVLLWSAPIGTSSKFANPGVGPGRIYVGTREGQVLGFGSPVTALLTGPTTEFAKTTDGSSSHQTLTLTASGTIEITGLKSSSSQFSAGTPTPSLPVKLSAGETIAIPLTFSPTQTGLIGGTLEVETKQGTVPFSLSGTGQAATAQLMSNPTVLSFGGTAVGTELSSVATFSNVGAAPLTIKGVKLPVAPFGATGAPEVGGTIEPGSSVTINITFEPTALGNFSGEVGLETSAGNASVALTGSAAPPGVLQIKSEQNSFGEVEVGKTGTRSFTITNTGGTTVTITKSKPPIGGAFAATTTLAEGSTIAPGESVTETVVFSPTATGQASGVWLINGTDTSGLHEVTFNGTGVDTFGKTSVGTLTDTFAAERKRVNRYSLATQGAVTKLSVYLAPTGTSGTQVMKGLIYGESSGAPGALLAVSQQLTYASTQPAGWYELTFAPPVNLPAGNYWIGVMTGATPKVAGFRYTSVEKSRDWNTNAYASGPTNPFGKPEVDAEQTSLYASYVQVTPTPVPVNSGAPTITGTPQQGQPLAEHHGSWTNEPLSYTYQWLQCETLGGSCLPIAGATGPTYVPAAGDVGHTIEVEETASNNGGSGKPATSLGTPVVEPPPDPENTSLPTITGTTAVGQVLSAQNGSWKNEPMSFTYQWERCEASGPSCSPIKGATEKTYTLATADAGSSVRVAVTASNLRGPSGLVDSERTAVIVLTPLTFGKTTVGTSSDTFVSERKRVNRYALATPGAVTKLSVYLAPTGTSGTQVMKGVIYGESSGAPGALLAVSQQLTYASTQPAAWYELTFAAPVKLAAGNYWIGVITGATPKVAGFRYTSVEKSRDWNSNTYASGPTNPFGKPETDAEQTSLYATYLPE